MRAGDPRAELIALHLPLARGLAKRYRRSGEPFEDLVQVASVGLVKAVDRWEPARGAELSTYATPTILGELRRHFRDLGWGIRPPRGVQELSAAVARAREALEAETGHSPTVAELARRLGCDEDAVVEALHARTARALESLDAHTRVDASAPTRYVDPELERVEQRATIERLTRILDARAREALRLRFDEDLVQKEIAARLGSHQVDVSRLLRRSLATLQAYARAA